MTHDMGEKSLIQQLGQCRMFSTLDEESLAKLAQQATPRTFEQGQYLYRIGESSKYMHFLLSGKVEVVNDTSQPEILIATIESGELTGEMGFLENQKRAASVRAKERVRALEFDQSALDLFLRNAHLSHETIKVVMQRLRKSNRELQNRYAELHELYQRQQESYTATISALSSALEMRDHTTFGHSDRVVAYSLILGKSLGMSSDELTTLRTGALLHDIGKIGVSDTILNKKSQLTEEEFHTMKKHPSIGETIVERIYFLQPAKELIKYHHERWDGKGYPEGLSGENIPLHARLFSLADVFDALTMERAYKDAWSFEDACQEIERCSGTQFDPHIVSHFQARREDFETILTRARAGKDIQKYLYLEYDNQMDHPHTNHPQTE